jgi:hypothetical protein
VTFVELPHQSLASWSMGDPLPQPIAGQRTITALFVAPNPAGQDFVLTLRSSEPIQVKIKQFDTPNKSPDLVELRRRLPTWTAQNARIVQVVNVSL